MTSLIQNVVNKCMDSDQLCNEFYLQLIKQTTDHPGKSKRTGATDQPGKSKLREDNKNIQ